MGVSKVVDPRVVDRGWMTCAGLSHAGGRNLLRRVIDIVKASLLVLHPVRMEIGPRGCQDPWRFVLVEGGRLEQRDCQVDSDLPRKQFCWGFETCWRWHVSGPEWPLDLVQIPSQPL